MKILSNIFLKLFHWLFSIISPYFEILIDYLNSLTYFILRILRFWSITWTPLLFFQTKIVWKRKLSTHVFERDDYVAGYCFFFKSCILGRKIALSKVFSFFEIGICQISKKFSSKKNKNGVVMMLKRILLVFCWTGTPVICY